VIARHRGSRRLVVMVMPSERLTSWRAELVYSPAVIRLLEGVWTRAQAESFALSLSGGAPRQQELRQVGASLSRALRLIETDAVARGLEGEAAAALAGWGSAEWATEPGGPPALQVLADWLEERVAGVPRPLLAETVVRRARRRSPA